MNTSWELPTDDHLKDAAQYLYYGHMVREEEFRLTSLTCCLQVQVPPLERLM